MGIVFFDTYAFLAIRNRSKNYEKHIASQAVTTLFNAYEYAWILRRELPEEEVLLEIKKIEPMLVSVDISVIARAVEIRLKNKSLSAPDAIGYAKAQELGIPFLTGDEDFRELRGVEFLKE